MKALKVAFYKDTANQWRWRLTAANNEPLSHGEGYKNRADMLHSLALVHGLQLRAGTTIVNPRQVRAWRWRVDEALAEVLGPDGDGVCHCGRPVFVHGAPIQGFTRGLCRQCDEERCDAPQPGVTYSCRQAPDQDGAS